MPKWVQHISGQGEKWELDDVIWNDRHSNKTWVTTPSGAIGVIELPRSEYHIVAPPEQWETCTRDAVKISVVCRKGLDWCREGTFVQWVSLPPGYCWAWSEKDPDALIIQRKVQP